MAERVVVDASVALSWVLPGEDFQRTAALRDRASDGDAFTLLVPPTFWFEVSNALRVAVRMRRLSGNDSRSALQALWDYQFLTWYPAPADCLDLGLELDIAVYDAAYVQIALDNDCPIWSVDRLLVRAASAAGLAVEPLSM